MTVAEAATVARTIPYTYSLPMKHMRCVLRTKNPHDVQPQELIDQELIDQ